MMRGRWKGVWEWQELGRLIRCGFEARSDAWWCGNVTRPDGCVGLGRGRRVWDA